MVRKEKSVNRIHKSEQQKKKYDFVERIRQSTQ